VAHAGRQHPNAPLTPTGRHRMVDCVLEHGWTISATAERFQVDAKTVRKWRDRFLAEGPTGLLDRSSQPRRSPTRTPRAVRREVIRLRRRHHWGANHIGHELGIAASTVQQILRTVGLGRLDRGDRATTGPVRRYQRDQPGELIHVDVKKLAGIPDGGGWRIRGRGYHGEHAVTRTAGYRFIHSALDDRTRLVYSEIHTDERGLTAAGFWHRAVAWFATQGISCERVLSDNGSCYKSGLWHRACAATDTTVKKTRPRRPQTNGKIERFHRILLEEWAYIRPWSSETERHAAYDALIRFYNHHRSHGALGWATTRGHPSPLQGQPPRGAHLVGGADGPV
jgi:transposase InsO family protein